jgi:hypothetical protein
VYLPEVEKVFIKFNNFAGAVANAITTEQGKNSVLDQVLHNVESYYFTSFPSDLYIDIFDFSKKIEAISASINRDSNKQEELANVAKSLESALRQAVFSSWAKNGSELKLGVHLIPVQGIAVPAASHELAYIRGSMSIDKSAFVEDSLNWVPNSIPKSDSLLDKLFYWIY